MRITLAKALLFACIASMSCGYAFAADATTYPDRPVKILVGFVPGGPSDLYARLMARSLSQAFGQQFIVENRAGASGGIAAAAVASAAPDGYTLLVNVVSDIITPIANPKVGYNLERGFVPIGMIASAPNVLVVHPSIPASSVQELVDHARKNPNALNYASAGTGTVSHLAGALLASEAGIAITHVPYKGTAGAQMDLLAGRITMLFDNLTNGFTNARAGKVKMLALTSSRRWPSEPNVPTMAESGYPGATILSVFGLVAPAGTPAPVVAKLSAALAKALQSEELRKNIVQSGAEPGAMAAAQYAKYIGDESRRWERFLANNPGIMEN